MASVKLWVKAQIDTGDEVRDIGNLHTPLSISLTGDGSVHHQKIDGVDTTSAAAQLYKTTSSLLSNGCLIFLVKASQDGFLTFGDLDSAAAAADTSSIPIKAGVWTPIVGQTFNVHGSDDAILRALNSTATIKELYYARSGGGTADVECWGFI